MELGRDSEKETLQSLIKSCLLELNKLKYDLTELEFQKQMDKTPDKIQELENLILDKEKEVSVIKFKAEEEIKSLHNQLNEKDKIIKEKEGKIYELNYVSTSLDEVKEYFAEQLKSYKERELAEVNERLNKTFKQLAEKDAYINSLSRQIDEFKLEIVKLENDVESQNKIMALEKELEIKNQELYRKDNELNIVKESSVPKDQYINLREELTRRDNELNIVKERSVPKDQYINLREELTKRDNRIKRLEELNEFFNELQQESNAFSTQDNTPPFRLDKK